MGVCWLLVSYENNGVETTLCSITKMCFYRIAAAGAAEDQEETTKNKKKTFYNSNFIFSNIDLAKVELFELEQCGGRGDLVHQQRQLIIPSTLGTI